MKRICLLVAALLGCLSHLASADTVIKNAGTTIGPIQSLNCQTDAGITCSRLSGSAGTLVCNPANAVEPGCVVPNVTQSFSGQKVFNNGAQNLPVAHGSLTACSGPNQGLEQTCSTHAAHVFCNGTSNIETTGTAAFSTLFNVPAGRMVHGLTGVMSTVSLPYQATVTLVSGNVSPSAGSTLTLRLYDGTNTCNVVISCTTGAFSAPAGSCTFPANAGIQVQPVSDTCTTPLIIQGDITVAGVQQ